VKVFILKSPFFVRYAKIHVFFDMTGGRVFVFLSGLVNHNKVYFWNFMNRYCFMLIIWFLAPNALICSQDTLLHDKLQRLEELQGEELRESIIIFYDTIKAIGDYHSRMALADEVFGITLIKDEIAHVRSLVFRAYYAETPQTGLFDQAFRLAEKYHRTDDMNHVEHKRALYFMAKKQYDSAMIHLLRYRDMIPPEKSGEGYREIINLLGDIYYHAGLYMQAREVYYDLYQQYQKEGNWNYFRPYVMMNNLGQIALKTGNLQEAGDWFARSLTLAEQYLKTPYRHNTLGYTKIKLAETEMMNGKLQVAERLLNEVAAYPEASIYEDVSQEWMFNRARLLLKKGKPDEAQQMAVQLLPGDSIKFSAYRFVPEIYRLFADISLQKGDYPLAFHYSNEYSLISDSLYVQQNLAGSMVILEEYNQKLTRLELQRSEQRILILITGLAILVVILFVILVLYRKLYKSKLELVRKTLEKDLRQEEAINETEDKNVATPVSEEVLAEQKLLIKNLKELMVLNKPYLDPGLSILEVARLLSSNRTYLSRAINMQLKTTFPNFINEYRISDSIRLITSNYTLNHTQEALARQSGFASRTVFINAFKKYTGVLPSFFVANYRRWDIEEKQFNKDE